MYKPINIAPIRENIPHPTVSNISYINGMGSSQVLPWLHEEVVCGVHLGENQEQYHHIPEVVIIKGEYNVEPVTVIHEYEEGDNYVHKAVGLYQWSN